MTPASLAIIEELWPDSDRQPCTAHRWRNVAAKLPKNDVKLHVRMEAAYWAALDGPPRRPMERRVCVGW